MTKALRFTALAGILALTSWLSSVSETQAGIRFCSNYQGIGCYPNPTGTITYCVDEYGQQMRCVCASSSLWSCEYL